MVHLADRNTGTEVHLMVFIDPLLNRILELEEDVRYQELASDSEPEFLYVEGQIPVLLSAPHGAVHTRRGKEKEEDEYTAGLARLLGEITGAHVLYTRRKSLSDPNYYPGGAYKKQMEAVCRSAKIGFILDIHGTSSMRPFGIELGTACGQSCPEHKERLVGVLERHGFSELNPAGLNKLWIDRYFTGGGSDRIETVTRFAWRRLEVPAAQFEINGRLRILRRKPDSSAMNKDFCGDPAGILRVIRAFTTLVNSLA
jgi:hypothetical protein